MVQLPGGFYCFDDDKCIMLRRKVLATDKDGQQKMADRFVGYYSDLPGVIKGWQRHYGRALIEEEGSIENILERFLVAQRAMTKTLERILDPVEFERALTAFRAALSAQGKKTKGDPTKRLQQPPARLEGTSEERDESSVPGT